MSEVKPTAGPWSVYDGGYWPGIEAGGANPKSLVVYGYRDEDTGVLGARREEAFANARIMAAGLEMVEALEALVEAADGVGETHNIGTMDPAIQSARAAIAKARGVK